MNNTHKNSFHLTKWFLDFIGADGSILICYAARLSWRGFTVPYTNILWQSAGRCVKQKTRYTGVRMPVRQSQRITWGDPRFKVSGVWDSKAGPIEARLYESEKGFLDWHCWQPQSVVTLDIEGQKYVGQGYAEVLEMTYPTWETPMQGLRWGHFTASGHWGVWIKINETGEDRQWVWWDGKLQAGCLISDTELFLPKVNYTLRLDCGLVLEQEKKIQQVVAKLARYLPGFRKIIPESFLLADACKWSSGATLTLDRGGEIPGRAIHEFVNFNPLGDGT